MKTNPNLVIAIAALALVTGCATRSPKPGLSASSPPVKLIPQAWKASWSPDGGQIAYDSDGDLNGWQDLWILKSDGSGEWRRESGNSRPYEDILAGEWSPDGQYVSYTDVTWMPYQGNWYWTSAYLKACTADLNVPLVISLSSADTDWNPDWQTLDITPPKTHMDALPRYSRAFGFTVCPIPGDGKTGSA